MIQPVLRHRVVSWRQRKCLAATAILSLFGFGLIGLSAFDSHAPLLVWNVSASVPIGLYRTRQGPPFVAISSWPTRRSPSGNWPTTDTIFLKTCP
jgi:type IV secretory pathway protease TraF